MKYKYISNNIIICDNFLPPVILKNIQSDLLKNMHAFKMPEWYGTNTITKEKEKYSAFNKSCGGYDYWINFGETPENNENILGLNTRFYNQGFFSFLQNQGRDNVFKF